jgi:hypothetical protein
MFRKRQSTVTFHFSASRASAAPFSRSFLRSSSKFVSFNLGAGAARFAPKQTSRTDRSPNFLQSGLRNFSSLRRPLNNLPWLFLLARLLELAFIFVSISDQSSWTLPIPSYLAVTIYAIVCCQLNLYQELSCAGPGRGPTLFGGTHI